MKALFAAELQRLVARRLVRALLLMVLIGIATGATIVFVRSHRLGPGSAPIARARADAVRQGEVNRCAQGEYGIPDQAIPPGMTLREFCEAEVIPEAQASDPRFHLVSAGEALTGLNAFLMLLMAVVGASFVGAEWHAGSMVTLLTWEPRRARVLLSKLAAVVLFAFVVSALLQAILGVSLLPAAVFRGTSEGADAAWLRSTAGVALRGAAVAAMIGAVSFSIASLARNTAAAIGAAFGYIAVLEPILRGLRPGWQRWLLYDNAATVILGHRADFTINARSVPGAALVLLLYVTAAVVVAVAAFRARDVS